MDCLEALKSMESQNTSGTDGLSAGFYKVFRNDISTFLIDVFNFPFETRKLFITERKGINKLIPKEDAEPYLIN